MHIEFLHFKDPHTSLQKAVCRTGEQQYSELCNVVCPNVHLLKGLETFLGNVFIVL